MREDQPVNLKEALKEDLQICNKQKLVFLNYIAQQHNPERDMSSTITNNNNYRISLCLW